MRWTAHDHVRRAEELLESVDDYPYPADGFAVADLARIDICLRMATAHIALAQLPP